MLIHAYENSRDESVAPMSYSPTFLYRPEKYPGHALQVVPRLLDHSGKSRFYLQRNHFSKSTTIYCTSLYPKPVHALMDIT